jgi:dCMP deaminase
VTRPSWDETFINQAREWSRRATCPRLACGCVIVDREKAVLASGYNGAPRRVAHCAEVGCLIDGGRCTRAVHAEQNAICQAARTGVALAGSTAYVTSRPCRRCLNLLAQAGVCEVVFPTEQSDSQAAQSAGDWDDFTALCSEAGVRWRTLEAA